MSDLNDPIYRQFVQSVIDNIKKNGFPEKKVAFGLEKMYAAAEKKGINFNKVLSQLDEIQIAHEKTPEKIVFFPKEVSPAQPKDNSAEARNPAGIDPSMFSNLDPSMFSNIDPSMFAGVDMSNLKGMNISKMMGAVSQMMKNMSPEQMNAIKGMYENMTDEQKKELMEKAKQFSPFNKDKNKD